MWHLEAVPTHVVPDTGAGVCVWSVSLPKGGALAGQSFAVPRSWPLWEGQSLQHQQGSKILVHQNREDKGMAHVGVPVKLQVL